MRKFLLSILFFVFACASVWGATYTYNYKAGFNSCRIAKTMVSEQTQFTLTMGVRAENTKDGTNWSSTLTLILLSTDGTLEGTYSTTDDDNKITDATNLVYSSSTRYPYAGEVSTFTITKLGAPDNYYRVSSGELHLTASSSYYNYTFCYGLDESGDVDDSETSYYDFKDIMSSITGTGSNLTLTLSGRGAMDNYEDDNSNRAPWYDDRSNIKHIIIEEGITSIGEYAFHGCNVEDITIPVSVKSFGTRAFYSRGTSMSNNYIYYAGTPNEWADIDFTAVGGYPSSHPFYNVTPATKNHIYFYNQKNTENKVIVFSEGLEIIKPYVLCYAGNITDICIPHSVASIGTKSFNNCGNLAYVTILNTSAPTAATDAFNNLATTSYLIVPSTANGSTSSPGFKRLPWYDNTYSGKGPKYIGYNDTDMSYTTEGNNFGTGKVYPLSGSNSDFSWELDMTGVLTLTGNGDIETNYSGSGYGNDNILPWARFRRLINKVIIEPNEGDFTSLNTVLRYHYALEEVVINQTTIPTHSYIISETNNVANNFDKLFDQRKNVVLKIKSASLADGSASNLGSEPWSNAKVDIQLSDNVVLSDGADNSTLVSNLQTYFADKTITLQLGRSLTNTQYNTFCSPIALTKEQLNDADIRELVSSSLDGDVLTLTFSSSSLDNIVAGQPYLVKPSSEVANPTFENIAPSSLVSATENTVTTYADFIGVLAPTPLTGGNKNTLFLGAGNELFWPEADGNIGGMRAYFSVKEAAQKNGIKARIVMKEDMATGFETVSDEGLPVTGKKILRNGQLFIIRDNKTYNAQGQLVK